MKEQELRQLVREELKSLIDDYQQQSEEEHENQKTPPAPAIPASNPLRDISSGVGSICSGVFGTLGGFLTGIGKSIDQATGGRKR